MKSFTAVTLLIVSVLCVSAKDAEAQCYGGAYHAPPVYSAPPVYYYAPVPQYYPSYQPYYSAWAPRFRYTYRSPGVNVTVRRGYFGNTVYRGNSRYRWRY